VRIVGLGLDHGDLPRSIAKNIEKADILVGGQRLLDRFQDHTAEKIPIKSPLDRVIKSVEQGMRSDRNVVVMADGDPGFFGIGKKLIEALGRERVELYPNVTVLQAAAAKIKIPWEGITTVSLHGRKDIWPLLRALALDRHERVAVFTDQHFHPGRIADELILRNVDSFRMHVFENICREDERIGSYYISEAKEKSFSPLNFILLERLKPSEITLHPGLNDDLYIHEKGLITKKEVRAVGLSLLEIQPHHTVWDLGAGCGSVAIEASVLAHEGYILAVEKEAGRAAMIRRNIQRTGAYGVEVIHGEMPSSLSSCPDPDRVFIGGGLGRSIDVLEEAAGRLKTGGRIVIHLVLMGSLSRARDYLTGLNWPFSITQVQISRSQPLAGDQRLESLNPVYILSAAKPHV